MKKIRLIREHQLTGAMNMASDEALYLNAIENGTEELILRLYDWQPACLSIGYFQSMEKKVDIKRCEQLGIDYVRRPTGGRAVLHDMELTYCVVAKTDILGDTVLSSYLNISEALNKGLNVLGVESIIAPAKKAKREHSAACFDSISSHEVSVKGKKIIGSAQYRNKGYLLQHGSILIKSDAKKLYDCLLPKVEDKGIRLFDRITTSISKELKRDVKLSEVEDAMIKGFEEIYGAEIYEDRYSEKEIEMRENLYSTKYNTKEWNFLK